MGQKSEESNVSEYRKVWRQKSQEIKEWGDRRDR